MGGLYRERTNVFVSTPYQYYPPETLCFAGFIQTGNQSIRFNDDGPRHWRSGGLFADIEWQLPVLTQIPDIYDVYYYK